MSTQTGQTSIRSSIVVDAPIERAFAMFTEGMGSWLPSEYSLLDVDIAERVFEAIEGGAIYDRGPDGSECHWAVVLVYDPPNRVTFSWDIGPHWQLEIDPAKASEVEVRFIAETAERTRVDLDHGHLDRHGDGWEQTRERMASDRGWPGCLQRFADQLADGGSR
jgi:uncharacterized protein YndB with AHSA1/START domain